MILPQDEITRLVAMSAKLDTEVTLLMRQVSDIDAKVDLLLEAHYQRAGVASFAAIAIPAVISIVITFAGYVVTGR